ncbi:MAG: fructosamine kinase family protein [Gillisia sp.]
MNEKKTDSLLHLIAEENQFKLHKFLPLSGGDINQVFLLTSESGKKVVAKINDAHNFPGMFRAEKAGLEALTSCNAINIPEVVATGTSGEYSYLLLQHIESGKKSPRFWEIFGKQLAALHKCTSEKFGFSEDNYIGSLPQQNNTCSSASEFYISQRLEPQLRIAEEKGFNLKVKNSFFKTISEIIPQEPPSLLHGDLWNGNFLVNSEGLPCLIDPAVAYAPREMDLSMMKLFGGFDDSLFQAYHGEFRIQDGFEERIVLWQLYYLLVHLNIFGAGYRKSVADILQQYS